MMPLIIGTLIPPIIVAFLIYLAAGTLMIFAQPGVVIVLLFFALVGFCASGTLV